ncbi:hypothetical protein KAR91_56640 [Candidatus Pacearchaeota archaeon]|nr:hypothetical protein [Candidatus Pacearchaeota archaeon]
MPSKPMELTFPLRGVNDGWGYGNQPEGTCPDALNVIPVDTLDSRIRGGQRWGTTKYFAALHNGANAIQGMTSIALSVEGSETDETFTQANGVLDDTSWYPCQVVHPNANISATYPHVQTNEIILDDTHASGSIGCAGFHKTEQITGDTFELSMDVTLAVDTDGYNYAGFIIRCAAPAFPNFSAVNYMTIYLKLWDDSGTKKFQIDYAGAGDGWVEATPGSGDWLDPAYWTTARELKIKVVGSVISTYVADVLIGSIDRGAVASYPGLYVGFRLWKNDKTANEITVDNWNFTNTASQSSRDYKLVSVSGGDVYAGRPAEGALTAATTGTNVVNTSGRIGLQTAFGKVYICDGVNANYSVWTASTNTVAAWAAASGTLPVSGAIGCRYIVLYRGRIVMAGLQADPHNWFMSAVDDPLDWDYGATVSETMAVAGNNTDTGKCPDIITCLAPYSDDMMFIGGDHTLWLMRGDPASRGRIDNVSYRTGISGPDAYAFDPNGIFYFFGQGTLWRMSAGGVPEPLSRNRMDVAFNAIDLTTKTVHLVWDNLRHGLHIFVVLTASGATTHYYWDERTDGFWPISFPNGQGPTTAYAFDGDDPDDNAVLFGGWDGYIRYIDPSVKNDDTIKISSHVLYPPIMAGGLLSNTRINGLTAIVDASADGVTLTAYAEDTPQGAIESATIRYARVLPAGRTRVLNRVAGNAIMFKLANATVSETWAIENIIADVEVIGRTRKNQL